MANVSKINVGGTTYDIKDATARDAIASLQGGMKYIGVTTTPIVDGGSINPIIINNESVTAVSGNVTIYGNKEFVYDGNKWDEFGDLSTLGSLAYKDSASGTFTPSGSITLTETTATINTLSNAGTLPSVSPVVENITPIASVGSLPSSSYDSATETVSISWGSLPTMGAAVSAITNVGFDAGSLPSAGSTTVVTGSTASFTGQQGNINVS